MKLNSQPIQYWIIIFFKKINKKTKKQPESTQVNLLKIILGLWDRINLIENK